MNMTGSRFDVMASKYVYVSDNKVSGFAHNNSSGTNNGITYDNSRFVLRYIIGI